MYMNFIGIAMSKNTFKLKCIYHIFNIYLANDLVTTTILTNRNASVHDTVEITS